MQARVLSRKAAGGHIRREEAEKQLGGVRRSFSRPRPFYDLCADRTASKAYVQFVRLLTVAKKH